MLQSVYSSPRDGYRIYPLSIADANAIGKHLDKEKGQDDPLNRAILEVLDKIAALEDDDNSEMEEVAIHASAIRNAFFDDRKRMEDVIPPVLLVTVEDRKEIQPRQAVILTPADRPQPVATEASKSKPGPAPVTSVTPVSSSSSKSSSDSGSGSDSNKGN